MYEAQRMVGEIGPLFQCPYGHEDDSNGDFFADDLELYFQGFNALTGMRMIQMEKAASLLAALRDVSMPLRA